MSSLTQSVRPLVRLRNIAVAVVATCAMIMPLGATASAAGTPGITVGQQSGYTATKISHPNAALGEDDGIVNVDANGNPTMSGTTGDRGQSYSWASVGYGDWMYIGTCYSPMNSMVRLVSATTGVKYSTLKAGVDAMFNGELYFDDGVMRPVLLKVNTRTGEVKLVSTAKAGSGYRAAVEFHDKLYFAAGTVPTPQLVEIDPATDKTRVVYTGKAAEGKGVSTLIRGLAVTNDQLVASMIGKYGEEGKTGAYIVSSSNPTAGQDSFNIIGTQDDFLGYPAFHTTDNIAGGAIWDIVPFNGHLYITVVTGTSKMKRSFALFRGDQNSDGTWSYKLLVGDKSKGAKYDFGFGADRSGAANMVVYKNHLYIGGYNDPMISIPDVLKYKFDGLYKDLHGAVNLWRMDADENFQMVAGEANDAFPEGPIGTIDGKTMRAGLGSDDEASRFLNQYVWRMQSYDGKMYAGTYDISDMTYPITQFVNGDILHRTPEQWKKQIGYIEEFLKTLEDSQTNAAAADGANATDVQSDDQKAVAKTLESGNADAVQSDVKQMQDLLGSMQDDLESKQTDVSSSAATPMAADARQYTLQDREQFQTWLQQLYDLYQKNKQYLPDDLVKELDQWLTQANVDNFGYFVGVLKYLSAATTDKRGFDLVVTGDGTNFSTITRNGFGDNNNHGLRVFAITDTGLNVGTANPFHGTQVWKLYDGRGDAVNASLKQNSFEYDKYDASAHGVNANGLSAGIDFNGNTVQSVQYDYRTLTEGTDYTVTDAGVTLNSSLLNGKETGSTGNVVVFFNRGARARLSVAIKDSTPGAQPSQPGANDADKKADVDGAKKTVTNANGKTQGELSRTGTAVAVIAVVVVVLAVAGVAVLVVRRKRS
ncbi:X2-like carbohydrate binding domain-containing protein [Bifidobacterium vansinderenii]|uniref:Carbohydrate binding domain X2 n=1 Tax=Bifidobacterium vansinderenii TaxID=1984871 RepID=A0A229VX42_9BIFI|nr:X2-like carbohydrate binding domain-containing protein [Bifidobacterium vansinderenii]OXN00106.1 Carbohydrate binding domain X2 [Bifidobacterium vansinderenii]